MTLNLCRNRKLIDVFLQNAGESLSFNVEIWSIVVVDDFPTVHRKLNTKSQKSSKRRPASLPPVLVFGTPCRSERSGVSGARGSGLGSRGSRNVSLWTDLGQADPTVCTTDAERSSRLLAARCAALCGAMRCRTIFACRISRTDRVERSRLGRPVFCMERKR